MGNPQWLLSRTVVWSLKDTIMSVLLSDQTDMLTLTIGL